MGYKRDHHSRIGNKTYVLADLPLALFACGKLVIFYQVRGKYDG
jgi:hypothetical protein